MLPLYHSVPPLCLDNLLQDAYADPLSKFRIEILFAGFPYIPLHLSLY